MNIGDTIVVLPNYDNHRPSEGNKLIGRDGVIVALDLKNSLIKCKFVGLGEEIAVFGGFEAVKYDRQYTRRELLWWLYVWEVNIITANSLPFGVYRCVCGAITSRKEKVCCDCINKLKYSKNEVPF